MTLEPKETQFKTDDQRIETLREDIRRVFPAERYADKITNHDGAWLPELTEESEILDDDKYLYEAVNGRTWTEVPQDYIQREPDAFVLLSDEALPALLPAWLIHSLENIDGENLVREFVIYSFCDTMRQFRVLNSEQRLLVRALMVEFSQREASPILRKHALEAVELIDRKRY